MSTEDVAGIAPGNKFTVARVNQELKSRSAIGAIFVNRDGDGSSLVPQEDDHNSTYAIDGRWGIGENILIEGWVAKSETPGRNGRDDAFSLKYGFSSEKWVSEVIYAEVGEDFNPEVGFLARSEYRKARAMLLRFIRPDDLWG